MTSGRRAPDPLPPPAHPVALPGDRAASAALHALIVDSDPARLARLADAVSDAGLQVTTVDGGAAAIDRRAGIDVFVLCTELADPGWAEVSERLRAQPESYASPILAWAPGSGGSAEQIRALELGADAYLTDPVDRELLRATVRALARRGAVARAAVEVRTFLEMSIDAAPVGLLLLDDELRCVGANAMLLELGLTNGPIEGRPLTEAMPGLTGRHIHDVATRVKETGDPYADQFVAEGPDAPTHWSVRVYRVTVPWAQAGGIGVMLEDVSPMERTLAELRANEQRWQAVFESDQIGVALRDGDYRVIVCNEAYARIYEAPSADALVGTDLAAVISPAEAIGVAERLQVRWNDPTAPDLHTDREYTLRSGRTVSIHASVSIVRDESGQGLYQLALVENRTEQKRLEEALSRARRIEAIGRLAGGVAHDVNNMLAVIIGYTEMIGRRLGHDHEIADDLAEITRAAEHSRSLAQDLLAFGRQQVLDRRPLVAGEIVRDLSNLLKRTLTEAVELTITDESRGAVVMGDRAQLETVIVNLAANGRDAMPDGGRLTIRIGAPMPAADQSTVVPISVADTGHGMTPEVRESIFEPFFTTKELGQGTGLGLATVAGIVEQMGGQIAVESTPGRGSRFTLTLPCERAGGDAPAVGDGPLSPASPAAGRTVLVVEDQPQVRRLVERMLGAAGYRVLSAGSAADALAALARSEVDLLLTDVILPDLRGTELARRAMDLRPDLIVVYTSGYAGDAVTGDGMPAGNGFLAKPFGSDDLCRTLDAAFAAAG